MLPTIVCIALFVAHLVLIIMHTSLWKILILASQLPPPLIMTPEEEQGRRFVLRYEIFIKIQYALIILSCNVYNTLLLDSLISFPVNWFMGGLFPLVLTKLSSYAVRFRLRLLPVNLTDVDIYMIIYGLIPGTFSELLLCLLIMCILLVIMIYPDY